LFVAWPSARARSIGPRATALGALVAASLAGAAPALGGTPDPGASSVAQYVELVPTAGGAHAPGIGKEQHLPLSSEAEHALEHISRTTAASLRLVGTSSTYGAPSNEGGKAGRVDRNALAPTRRPTGDQSLQAIAAAAASADDARMIGLLLVLATVTVVGAALSLRGRF
jgi:hypothetical protein